MMHQSSHNDLRRSQPHECQAQAVYSPIAGRHILLTQERIEGLFWGVALPDALGLPAETMSAEQIAGTFGVLRSFVTPDFNHWYKGKGAPIGTTSDDAQLTAAVFDAFSDAGGYSLSAISRRHIEAYDESSDGWGGSTVAGVLALKDGLIPGTADFTARLKSGTGNGIPMKVGAVAAYLALTGGGEREMIEMVQGLCSLSHPTSIAVSSGLAHVAGLLYCFAVAPETFDVDEFVAITRKASALGRSIYPHTLTKDDITTRLEQTAQFAALPGEQIAQAFGNGSCYVYDSLPFSYAYFLRKPLSFDAVIDVINAGGDTDSNGALVGALQGALLGKRVFEPSLCEQLALKSRFDLTLSRFMQRFGIS